jgi:hypothetical protein
MFTDFCSQSLLSLSGVDETGAQVTDAGSAKR